MLILPSMKCSGMMKGIRCVLPSDFYEARPMNLPMPSGCIRACLMMLLAIAALPGFAQTAFVYRFDTRPPQEIFATGFAPRGTNLDLMDRLTRRYMRSRGTDNSGLIATTADSHVALQIAGIYMAQRGLVQGYIYRIRADQNFYSANLSLRDLRQRRLSAGTDTSDIDEVIEDFGWEQTYVSDRAITADMIIAVDSLMSTGTPPLPGAIRASTDLDFSRRNPHYVSRDTYANPGAYPMPGPAPRGPSLCPTPRPSSDDSAQGGVGPNCEDDVFAIASPGGYLSLGGFPDCLPPRDKRSTPFVDCQMLPVVNLSMRRRVLRVLLADSE